MNDADRARSLVERLIAEDRERDRLRFRDVEAEGALCWREYGLDALFLETDGYRLFHALQVVTCNCCGACAEVAMADDGE